MNNITGNVLKSNLARVSMTALLAGVMTVAVGASANAYDGWHRHWQGHWHHWHPVWHGYYGGWYRPYYYVPPVVTYPPAYGYDGYYAPPPGVSLNFNL